jgi:anti-sigma factor RsiW
MTAAVRPISEDELQAWVDDRLDAARRQEVDRYLATQPELMRRLTAYQVQRDGLRQAFAMRAAEPIPPELNLGRLIEARLRTRWLPWRVAAAIVLALGIGGAGGWYLGSPSAPDRTALAVSLLRQQAMTSHTVYAADGRHPIEVAASEREHLARWLSNRLHRTVAPPDLSAAGYQLLGGRLLATEHGGAAALFMYVDAAGNRLSVVMRPMADGLHAARSDVSEGAVNGCTWIDRGIGYAVVAAAPDAALDQVAREISQQMGASG